MLWIRVKDHLSKSVRESADLLKETKERILSESSLGRIICKLENAQATHKNRNAQDDKPHPTSIQLGAISKTHARKERHKHTITHMRCVRTTLTTHDTPNPSCSCMFPDKKVGASEHQQSGT